MLQLLADELDEIDDAIRNTKQTLAGPLTVHQRETVEDYLDRLLERRHAVRKERD